MTSKGGFRGGRRAAFAAQALVALGLPFVEVGGESALRFDVPTLRLHAFGAALQIDELFLPLAAVIAAGFVFALVTLVLGRVWCGWACPQTALAEVAAALLPARGGGARRGAGYLALAALSALVAANLLSYFVPPADFARRAASATLGPVLGGAWLFLGGSIFLHLALVGYRFCATVCPYAKLQGALFDDRTLVVAYDARRDAECIDCGACVRACPTGIDIRRGLQAACIACAQCADACGPILARLGRPSLVGYALGEPGSPRRGVVRTAAVLLAVVSAAAVGLAGAVAFARAPLDLTAAATPGAAARRTPDGRVVNAYDVNLTNRTGEPADVALALSVAGARASLVPDAVRLAAGEHRRVRVLAALPLAPGATAVPGELSAEAGGRRISRPVTFVPPNPGGSR